MSHRTINRPHTRDLLGKIQEGVAASARERNSKELGRRWVLYSVSRRRLSRVA